ncbi:hypothetical protein [Flavobacterium aurantiibacter]|uniref:Uncharacterized protein n=1 Tax=Flavobacterium aurantiibacter TaxID=2023067 RepID=A0A256A476_9FLAO|nr:hypothetical protein [Flavobacterium aurantiibacter]OYQ48657.1 hypothetical protein CHX27_02050 [Flavobacterium aurantiibacter]
MKMPVVDLEKSLKDLRKKEALHVENTIRAIFENLDRERADIKARIENSDRKYQTLFKQEKLDLSRVYSLESIRELALSYRLRFLPSSLFISGIPEDTITKVRALEKEHDTTISSFFILAPAKSFKLKSYDDPLLFTYIGDGLYYLIDKWGTDLSAVRKIQAFPLRNLNTFLFTCVVVSILLTLCAPISRLGETVPMAGFILFLFMFKSVIAVAGYCLFMNKQNLSSVVWNSDYREE